MEEDKENLYLVEEYVQGLSPASAEFLQNGIKDSELVSIVTGLFDFLKFINSLEEAVLYIDWKPGNIILTETGIKVVDFGSVLYSEDCSNFTGLATEGFAAPELRSGGKPGRYTDIYGCIIFSVGERKNSLPTLIFCKKNRNTHQISCII